MTARLAPKGDTYYNQRAENYEARRKRQAWWHVEQTEMEALLNGLPEGLSVLDVPFGTGRFVPYYAARGFRISGLDASGQMIDAARKALGPDLFRRCHCSVGDASALPFDDASFDLLVSTRFLRDIVTFGAAKAMLAEFARVTRRYAIIQLGVNTAGDEDVADDEVMAGRMSRTSVEALLRDHGFMPVDFRCVKTDESEEVHHILCHRVT
ncbi:class I SAM-dependent methyltransferase [Aliigemmobacter aestuarii]|uniref:Class I SAM-dependent methyltransferase n=1 Tax=Aliigemmobacter aestuarii TaxID=1445661 RepID=A0A4S3MNY3_9RHOB|nr:class I SAM-dependent methyltransferase [Gemmobacter aestuarii]THD82849.1 class I SAM-dependent methyltransferase [Gemmobacter aestuarii]